MQKAKHGYGTGKLNPNFFWLFRGLWDERQQKNTRTKDRCKTWQ